MPRESLEKAFKGSLQMPRERVWTAIKSLTTPEFDRVLVQDKCSPLVRFGSVSAYMTALERAGYIERANARARLKDAVTYRLTPAGAQATEAPRVNDDGKPITLGLGRECMWRAMKVLGIFDCRTLAKAASLGDLQITVNAADAYIKGLNAAGYLLRVSERTRSAPATWRLIRNTGPHAPSIVVRKGVFDRNNGTFVPVQTAQEVCDGIPE